MTVTIKFEKPAEYLNANDRQHWAVKSKRTKAWREAAAVGAIRRGARPQHGKRIVGISLPVASLKVRRDGANWHPTLKAAIDGLVDAGVFVDDSGEYVVTSEPTFHQGGNTVIVTITEIAA